VYPYLPRANVATTSAQTYMRNQITEEDVYTM
jgi:hypothetical protein